MANITSNVENAIKIANQVNDDALNLRNVSQIRSQNNLWLTLTFSIVGAIAFGISLIIIWRRFKRSHINKLLGMKPEVVDNTPYNYRIIFLAVGLIGVLLFASPTIGLLVKPPSGEQFSELYLLGPGHMAENYPSNIAVGQNYSVYVNVGNHLWTSAYYVLYMKLGNETDQLPNATLGTASSLQSLYEYRFSIQDSLTWESLLTFSVPSASISGNNSQINTLQINDIAFNVDKPAVWDLDGASFKYHILFELWIYNSSSSSILFNDRFVNPQLNLTKTL
jgi:hypothetical protein